MGPSAGICARMHTHARSPPSTPHSPPPSTTTTLLRRVCEHVFLAHRSTRPALAPSPPLSVHLPGNCCRTAPHLSLSPSAPLPPLPLPHAASAGSGEPVFFSSDRRISSMRSALDTEKYREYIRQSQEGFDSSLQVFAGQLWRDAGAHVSACIFF